jgi:hypothetical protein
LYVSGVFRHYQLAYLSWEEAAIRTDLQNVNKFPINLDRGKRWLASFTYPVQAGQFSLERFIEQFVPVVARDPHTISLAVSVSPSVLPARRAPLAAAKTVAASVFSSSVMGIALTGQGG